MKKKKVDKCLKVTREMNEEMKMDEEQIQNVNIFVFQISVQ